MNENEIDINRLNQLLSETTDAVNQAFRDMRYPLKEIDFIQTWDWTFMCPRCSTLADKNICQNCKGKLTKDDLFFLRLAWLEPPEPNMAYEDLIKEEEKSISDIEFQKAKEIFSRTYADIGSRELPSHSELRTAIEYLKWANKLDGHYASAIIAAGVCYYLLGEYIQSILCWAHEAEAEDIDSLYYLFKAYQKVGWYSHAFGVAKMITDNYECESSRELIAKRLSKIPPKINQAFIESIDHLIEKEIKELVEDYPIMYRPADEFFG